MPIAKSRTPDGEVFEYYVPEGTTPEMRSRYLAPRAYERYRQGIDVTQPPPVDRTLGGWAAETGKGLLSGAAGLVEAGAEGASYLLPEEAEAAAQEQISDVGSAVQEALAPARGYEDTIPRKFAEAAGSTIPFLAAAPFGIAGLLGGATLGVAAGAGEASQRARASGATEEEQSRAAGFGMIPGALEMVAPYRILSRALGKGPTQSVVRRMFEAASEEGAQEAVSEVAQNLISRGIYDPERGVFTDTGESFGYGAGVGGLLQGLTELLIPGRRRAPTSDTSSELSAEEEAALGLAQSGEVVPTEQVSAYEAGRRDTREVPDDIIRRRQATEEARAEGPGQRELFPELLRVDEAVRNNQKTEVTEKDLTNLGVRKRAKVVEDVRGKNITDPEQRSEVIASLQNYINNPIVKQRSPETRRNVMGLISSLETASTPTPATQRAPDDQMDIEEQITRSRLDDIQAEETARTEQEKEAAFEAAEQERAAQEEAVEQRAIAQEPAPPSTAMAEEVRRAQREATVPLDEGVSNMPQEELDVVQQIAEQQRRAEAAEAQEAAPQEETDEQLSMIGPRGGVTTRQRQPQNVENSPQEQPAPEPEAEEAPEVEDETTERPVELDEDTTVDPLADENPAVDEPVAGKAEITADEITVDQSAVNEATDEIITNYFMGNSFEEGLFNVAKDIIERRGEPKVRDAYQWLKSNLSASSRRKLANYVRELQSAYDQMYDIPGSAVAQSTTVITPATYAAIQNGDLQTAIQELTRNPSKHVSKVARAVLKGLGNTKVALQAGLVDKDGNPIAGKYIPQTDTIAINPDLTPTNHTLLHEAMHAVTSHRLANRSDPIVKQLEQAMELARTASPSAYGVTNVDEFVAEAFSNPEFQSILAGIHKGGEKITAWDRVVNAVKNVIRVLRGLPTQKIESQQTVVDGLVSSLISPAPSTRAGPELHMIGASTTQGESTINQLGRMAKGEVAPSDVAAVRAVRTTGSQRWWRSTFSFLPLNAIAEITKDDVPAVYDFLYQIEEKVGNRQQYLQKVRDMAKLIDKPFEKQPEARAAFNRTVIDSTRLGVDPTKDRTDYKSAEDKATWDMLNDAEHFGALNEAQKQAYARLRDEYKAAYEQLEKVITERVDKITQDTGLQQSVRDKVLQHMLKKQNIDPYFPLFRKGHLTLTFYDVDPSTNTVEPVKMFFDSEIERQKAIGYLNQNKEDRLQRIRQNMTPAQGESEAETQERLGTYLTVETGDKRLQSAEQRARQEVSPQFAYGLMSELDAAIAQRPADQRAMANELKERLMETVLDAMPEGSIARMMRKRMGTLGAEENAIQVFRERMNSFMTQLSNLENDIPIIEARRKAVDQINTARENTPEKTNYLDELQKAVQGYSEFARNPQLSTWSRALKSVGFAMTLGVNVSSVVVNATNLGVVVLPYLGGKYGFAKTTNAMSNARKVYFAGGRGENKSWIMREREVEGLTGPTGEVVRAAPSLTNIDFTKDVPAEYTHYKELSEHLDKYGQAARSMVGDALDFDNPSNTLWTKTNAVMGALFHQGERFNRQITAIAAYDLQLDKMVADRGLNNKNELSVEDRQQAARQAINDTELTNSGAMTETAPRVAQNNWGSWLMMYKRFGISMYYLQFKMARDMLKGADPETRRHAKRQIAGLFASSAAFAGLQGLPLYGVVAMLWDMFLTEDDEENFDSLAARFVGEGMYSGLLNELTGTDVAARVGMTNLVFRSQPNREQDNLILAAMEYLGGPIFGIASRAESGAQLLREGHVVRGIERFLPSAVSNGMKAVRYAEEGGPTTLRGDPITQDMNYWNIFAQAMGFAPADYTRQLEINARDKRIDTNISERRTRLMRQYYIALREGDLDEARDVASDMMEFSQRHPEVAITGDSIGRSIRQHQRTDAIMRLTGGVTFARRRLQKILQDRALNEELDF